MDINLANSECIQTISNIGYKKMVNICDGSSTVVPWGSADWIVAIIVSAVIVAVALMSIPVIKMMRDDY